MRLVVHLCLCFVTAPLVPAQMRTPDPGQDDAVRELVARYASARALGDARVIGALFTEDADQLVSSGEWRRGRDALVRGMLESSRQNAAARTLTVEWVRAVAPGVALADARYEIAGVAGAEPRKMWSSFLAVRTADGWRIAAIRNMLPGK